MSATVPRHDVVVKHREIARERLELLSGLVGLEVVYLGERDREGLLVRGALYPERVGRRCLVAGVSQDRGRCPLLIVFQDGYRGIAEAEWLVDGEGGA